MKVRGFRIELGEVEAALLPAPRRPRRPRSSSARTRPGERRLVAYVVPADPAPRPDGRRPAAPGSSDRLPEYMVPVRRSASLDALPLTPNGKVDRRALAALEPPPRPRRGDAERVGPRTPAEAALARIAAEVLGVAGIGVHDNFFELGIDSILIIQIVSRARQAGLELTPALLFRHPTIAELAAVARRPDLPAAAGGPPAGGLLDPGSTLRVAVERGLGGRDRGRLSPLPGAGRDALPHARRPRFGVYVEQFTCRLGS